MMSDCEPLRHGDVTARARTWRVLGSVLLLLLSQPWQHAVAAIAVSKSIDGAHTGLILPGDVTAFRVTLTNDNPTATVNAVQFTDDMTAAGITVAGAGLLSNACAGAVTATVGTSIIALTGGIIPQAGGGGALGSCDIVVEVTATAMGTSPQNVIAVGVVTGTDSAGAQTNGSQAVQSFSVLTMIPPLLRKSFAPTTVIQNDQVATLKLEIENPNNNGTLPLTTVTDNLPTTMQVAASPNASVVCTGTGAVNSVFAPAAAATTLTITGGAVGRSGICTYQVNVIGTAAGATGSTGVTNALLAADVGNARGLTPAANASATLTVKSPLRVTKAFAASPSQRRPAVHRGHHAAQRQSEHRHRPDQLQRRPHRRARWTDGVRGGYQHLRWRVGRHWRQYRRHLDRRHART